MIAVKAPRTTTTKTNSSSLKHTFLIFINETTNRNKKVSHGSTTTVHFFGFSLLVPSLITWCGSFLEQQKQLRETCFCLLIEFFFLSSSSSFWLKLFTFSKYFESLNPIEGSQTPQNGGQQKRSDSFSSFFQKIFCHFSNEGSNHSFHHQHNSQLTARSDSTTTKKHSKNSHQSVSQM